jgi:zinc transport system ATP-binding protein
LHASKELLIDADNLQVRFGGEIAIEDVSLCIHKGEFVGLIGPNGAGKTSLLRAVLGLIEPSKGTVRKRAVAAGYIPQRGALYNGNVPISAFEVVLLGSRGSKPVAFEALEAVRMTAVAHRRFNELSGGQQQRIVLAKALASNADLLILDEPTTGIDERLQNEFYELLRTLQQRGITIIMVSHEVDTVLRLVTRVICLNRTILYDGPPEHFEADTYLPKVYAQHHRQLHHRHGGHHA